MWSDEDIYFMKLAIEEGERAERLNEVPIGAVLTMDGQLLSMGHNCPVSKNDPTAHAEIRALRSAGEWLKNYRLPKTTIYVTLEPCLMCFGALIQARVLRVVFGAYDSKLGTSRLIKSLRNTNHSLACEGGLLEKECCEQLQSFFRRRRQRPLVF
jgi:tRNA(adenine34) deaminase